MERVPVRATQELPPPPLRDAASARQAGYLGEACRACGSLQVVQSGTCRLCLQCYTPSGSCGG